MEPLEQLIERSRRGDCWPLPEPVAAALLRPVLETLAAAHREDPPRIHRDVSARTVRVSESGTITLEEFGATHSASVSSPEQARGRPLNARSDVFCAGHLLF